MEEKRNKKNKILMIILVLLVLVLGGYIVYEKVLDNKVDEPIKTEKKKVKIEKKEQQPKWDLSAVPETEAACTYNTTIDEVNNLRGNNIEQCQDKLTKYIVNNVKIDGIEQNIQIVIYEDIYNDKAEQFLPLTGLYLNGKKVCSLAGFFGWATLSIHDNMLFAHIDSGSDTTGYVNILVFDKMGKEVYNLEDKLKQSVIIDPISSKSNAIITANDILRNDGSINIADGEFTFVSYMTAGDVCVNGYRGSIYKVTYEGTKFSEITRVGGYGFKDDDCTVALN